MSSSSLSFDVVVVGAGLSGFMACDILSRPEHSVTRPLRIGWVEARDRMGGRVETHESGGGIDVGAQWIGPSHTELLGCIQRYHPRLTLLDQFYPAAAIPVATQRLTECVGFRQLPLCGTDAQMVQDYMALIARTSLEIDLDAPWTHPMAESFDNMSAQDHIAATIPSSSQVARDEVQLFCQTVVACRVDRISFLFLLLYIKSGGGMAALGDGEHGAQKWKLEGGMVKLTHLMEQDILDRGVTILKSSPVERVKNSSDGTTTTTHRHHVELHIKGGTKVNCDRVIFALSPQLVAKMEFSPPLDHGRIELGRALRPGRAIKVLLSFDRPFWLDDTSRADTDEAAMAAFTNGPVHNFFHANMGDSPALVGLITGATAEHWELVPDLKSAVVQQIQTMYRVQDVPTQYIEKRWGLEEFSGGCFAGVCPPDGTLFRLGHLLRKPERTFHWASTETATEFYGYMEGALLAGKRAAHEVLEYYK